MNNQTRPLYYLVDSSGNIVTVKFTWLAAVSLPFDRASVQTIELKKVTGQTGTINVQSGGPGVPAEQLEIYKVAELEVNNESYWLGVFAPDDVHWTEE